MSIRHDVVVAGAGVAGALIASVLAEAGFDVGLVDAGPDLFRSADGLRGDERGRQAILEKYYTATARVPNAPYPYNPHAPIAYVHLLDDPPKHEGGPAPYYAGPAYGPDNVSQRGEGGHWGRFSSTATKLVGGTTHHWMGTSLRLFPDTFQERTLYDRAVDWPFTYDELAPWYTKAERELGVAGAIGLFAAPPRDGAVYPMPPVPTSYFDRLLSSRVGDIEVEGRRLAVQSTPQARNTTPYQGRPACAGSSSCIPVCPIAAKYDATVHVRRALAPGASGRSATLYASHVVRRVALGPNSRVSHLEVCRVDGDRPHPGRRIRGRLYVLAMGGIETPKLLLCSRGGGVSNSSGAVGRYLMDHLARLAVGSADEPVYPFRGPLSTSGIETFRSGEFRRRRAPFRIEVQNVSAEWAKHAPYSVLAKHLREGRFGRDLWRHVAWDGSRLFQINGLFEPEPQYESRVRLSHKCDALGIPRPRLDFIVDDYTQSGVDVFDEVADAIVNSMSRGTQTVAEKVDGLKGSGHIMGTCRMGRRACDSVTNADGRSWDHENLYIAGSSLFPTVGTANPTLTIAALALRQAEKLASELREP